jgi:hypothetical protein
MATLKNTTLSDTGFIRLPVGTTGQRPSPAAGQFRYNTTTGAVEVYTAGTNIWQPAAARGVRAAGGTVYDVDVEGTTYRVHVFTATGNSTFTVTRPGTVEYLIVAGGGPGGAGNSNEGGGGGGAGGLLTGTTTVTPQAYTITVGAGGPGTTNTGANSTNGSNSTAFGLTAIGGGAGGSCSAPSGNSGGSGGGGGGCSSGKPGGNGTAGQGNSGGQGQHIASAYPDNGVNGNGGGGGGAGSPGISGAFRAPFNSTAQGTIGGRGTGINLNITGLTTMFAEGGNGGAGRSNHTGANATPNTGNGGGGSAGEALSGAGGSGIVIIRYPLQSEPDTTQPKIAGDGVVLDLDFAKPTVYPGSGTVVTDSRLNGLTGTLVNSPAFVNSRTHRSAFSFNGSNTRIATNFFPEGFRSYFIWIKYNTLTHPSGYQLTGTQEINAYNYIGIANGGNFYYFMGTNGEQLTGTSLIAQVWYQQGLTLSSDGNVRAYLNGVLVNTQASGVGVRSTTEFSVGAINQNHWINGEIAQVLQYNRALTGTEVSNNFNATRWRFGV